MAGPVALLAAKRMPGTVVAVVGIDTLQNAESQLPEEVRTKFLTDFEKDFKGTMRLVVSGMVHEKTDAELKEWLVTRASAQDPKMGLALMRDLFGLDTATTFKEAQDPVRCVNSAGGDLLFSPPGVQTTQKRHPLRRTPLPTAAHHATLLTR